MSRTYRQWIARIAAAALLFSALSPAMAGVLFSDRPDILARVLALPSNTSEKFTTDICHQDRPDAALLSQSAPRPADDGNHGAHGIFCSFCLASATWLGMPAPPPALAVPVDSGVAFIPTGKRQPPAAHPRATRHPRDPPLNTVPRS